MVRIMIMMMLVRYMRKDGTLRFGDFVAIILNLTVAFCKLSSIWLRTKHNYKYQSLCKSSPNYVLQFASFASCHPWPPSFLSPLPKRLVKEEGCQILLEIINQRQFFLSALYDRKDPLKNGVVKINISEWVRCALSCWGVVNKLRFKSLPFVQTFFHPGVVNDGQIREDLIKCSVKNISSWGKTWIRFVVVTFTCEIYVYQLDSFT